MVGCGRLLECLSCRIGAFFAVYQPVRGGTSILAFQEPYVEKEWTKGDLLDALGAYGDAGITDTLQLWSGCFIIKKSAESVEMVRRWVEVNAPRRELITDRRSRLPNLPGFKEHRHDQSSFSVLAKQTAHVEIASTETQPATPGDWASLAAYPIQARRHKLDGRPLSVVLRNKLLRPWRTLLGLYFRHVRHYEWLGSHYPW